MALTFQRSRANMRNSLSMPVGNSKSSSLALGPAILAHGAGVGGWDEVVIFGGIGLIVVGLIFLSWRAGRKRKQAEARRRKPR